MMRTKVSIIVPTYMDWERLSLCIEALSRQSYPQELTEVLIVNNKPEDTPPSWMELPENFRLLKEGRPGSYAARNAALRECTGEIIGFTDSDCIPEKDWIKNAVSFLENHKEFSRVGGAIEIFYKEEKPSRIELYDGLFAFPQESYVRSGNAVTANMFTYRSVFDAIGYFDEHLMSGGDYQWGKMADKNGYRISYVPDALVKHPARPSLRELVSKAKRVGKGQGKFRKSKAGTPFGKIRSLLRMFKPRFWEIRRIMSYKQDVGYAQKIFLIFLRHYVLIVGDFERIRNS